MSTNPRKAYILEDFNGERYNPELKRLEMEVKWIEEDRFVWEPFENLASQSLYKAYLQKKIREVTSIMFFFTALPITK